MKKKPSPKSPRARKLKAWWRRPEVAFPRRFLAYGLGAGLLYMLLVPFFPSLTHATAVAAARATQATGMAAQVLPGQVVAFGGGAFRYQIIAECTGLMMFLIYGSAVM